MKRPESDYTDPRPADVQRKNAATAWAGTPVAGKRPLVRRGSLLVLFGLLALVYLNWS